MLNPHEPQIHKYSNVPTPLKKQEVKINNSRIRLVWK